MNQLKKDFWKDAEKSAKQLSTGWNNNNNNNNNNNII